MNLVLFSASVEIRDLKEKGEGEDGGCYTLPVRVSAVSAAYILPVIVACPVRAAAQIATHSTRSLTSSTHTHTHTHGARHYTCVHSIYILVTANVCQGDDGPRQHHPTTTCNIHLIILTLDSIVLLLYTPPKKKASNKTKDTTRFLFTGFISLSFSIWTRAICRFTFIGG